VRIELGDSPLRHCLEPPFDGAVIVRLVSYPPQTGQGSGAKATTALSAPRSPIKAIIDTLKRRRQARQTPTTPWPCDEGAYFVVLTLDTVTLGAASVATVTVGAGARASVATAVPGSSISHSACAVNDERPSSRAVARIAFMISPNELRD
jgi:hypothetical protein